jgi:hypothetical protein
LSDIAEETRAAAQRIHIMESLLQTVARRARGVVGMALTWGVAWIPFSLAFGMVAAQTWEIWTFDPRLINALVKEGFVAGALNGAAFSIVLAAIERRRKFGELKPRRFAAYGVLAAGAIAAVLTGASILIAPGSILPEWLLLESALFVGLGAASAAGSLAIARRGLLLETPEHFLENPGGNTSGRS